MEDGGGEMRYLSVYSGRIKTEGNFVGLDDRFWLRVEEHKQWFRKPFYSIELILSRRENKFSNRDAAIAIAQNCIADMHDLIERQEAK
jgi:hypothetical protein